MEQNDDTYWGISKISFADAAKAAVEEYERINGPPPEGEPVELRVVEMAVTVENPVRDYRVKLGPGG
jgi:hypothetical protein